MLRNGLLCLGSLTFSALFLLFESFFKKKSKKLERPLPSPTPTYERSPKS